MKAQWIEGKFGFFYLPVAHGLQVVIGWETIRSEESGYKVSFGDAVLKKRFQDVPSAKTAGVALAKRVLSAGLAALSDEETQK